MQQNTKINSSISPTNYSTKKLRKCLIICPIFAPYGGGGGQYFPFLRSSLLINSGFTNIDVITEFHTEKPLIESDNLGKIYRILPKRDSKERKNLIYYIFSFVLTYLILIIFLLYSTYKSAYQVVVFTRYYRKLFYKILNFSKKSVTNFELYCDLRATVSDLNVFNGLEICDKIICNSEAVYGQASGITELKSKCVLITNPINFDFPVKGFEAQYNSICQDQNIPKNFILFVGQLLQRKSIIEVLDAFELTRRKYPEMGLVIIGRNMMGKILEEKLQNKNVFYLGEQDRNIVLWFMKNSNLVTLPSKIEGIPRVALEALYLGKKVILAQCVPEFVKSDPTFVAFDLNSQSLSRLTEFCLNRDDKPKYDTHQHSIKYVLPQYQKLFSR